MGTNEYHIYGPPGTGKTTTLQKNITLAVEKHGREGVMVSSFTRAAATEVIERGVPIAKNMIGTLHSLCYRGLEAPDIAELHIAEFNDRPRNPYRLTRHQVDVQEAGEGYAGTNSGDECMARYQVLRARMVPPEAWPTSTVAFSKIWESWKRESKYFDFNDLIEVARDEFPAAPGHPRVMFVDEAQDLSALQFSCIRRWAEGMERLVLLGDDDQAIYSFSGADAANLLDRDIPEANKIVLRRSYRVPRAVLEYASSWIGQISHRQEKVYEPRDADGEVRHLKNTTWKHPDAVVDDIKQQVAAGKTVMVLTTCAYMLNPIIALLHDGGLLYHNPYRVVNGSWNPVRSTEGSTLNRILAFLKGDFDPEWTYETLGMWIDLVRSKGLLHHGAKNQILALAKGPTSHQRVGRDEYRAWFAVDGPWDSFDPWSGREASLMEWIARNAAPAKSKGINYIKNCVDTGNLQSLYAVPKIIVGTIHSVKGGEADVVYLFPDVSRVGYDNWVDGGAGRDDVVRQMYVGMTRAKVSLIIPENAGGRSVPL